MMVTRPSIKNSHLQACAPFRQILLQTQPKFPAEGKTFLPLCSMFMHIAYCQRACQKWLSLHGMTINQTAGAGLPLTSSPEYPLTHPSVSAQPQWAHPAPAREYHTKADAYEIIASRYSHGMQDVLLGGGVSRRDGRQRPLGTCEIERAVRVKLSARCTSAAVKNLVTWTTRPAGRPQISMSAPPSAFPVSETLAKPGLCSCLARPLKGIPGNLPKPGRTRTALTWQGPAFARPSAGHCAGD